MIFAVFFSNFMAFFVDQYSSKFTTVLLIISTDEMIGTDILKERVAIVMFCVRLHSSYTKINISSILIVPPGEGCYYDGNFLVDLHLSLQSLRRQRLRPNAGDLPYLRPKPSTQVLHGLFSPFFLFLISPNSEVVRAISTSNTT